MDEQREQLEISLEDVANLRRMYVQQFRRLVEAKERGDGPAAGRALADLAQAHIGCEPLFDVAEYLLTERGRLAALVEAYEAAIYGKLPDTTPSMSGFWCRLCGHDVGPAAPRDEHRSTCMLFDDGVAATDPAAAGEGAG